MIRALYICGLIAFVGSFFAPSTPQKMTTSHGEKVELWTPPVYTHFRLAGDPIIRLLDYCHAVKPPDAH